MSKRNNYQKEDIIDALVKQRIELCASTRTLLTFLETTCNIGKAMQYQYLIWMRERIAESYQENSAVKEETILQYEEVIERMRKEKNWKMWSELNRELNKIKQIAIEKKHVDITSNGQTIFQIILPNENDNKAD